MKDAITITRKVEPKLISPFIRLRKNGRRIPVEYFETRAYCPHCKSEYEKSHAKGFYQALVGQDCVCVDCGKEYRIPSKHTPGLRHKIIKNPTKAQLEFVKQWPQNLRDERTTSA